MKKPNVILVLYYTRGVYPLRDAIRTHLYCWQEYSSYRYIYVNVAFGFPWNLLRKVRIAGVIYHTKFLAMRWSPSIFQERTALCAPLADLDVPKIAMPQDEFIHTDMLAEFLARHRITHLFTCAEEADWRKIYGRFLDFTRTKVRTVLTGYIDERTRIRVDRMKRRARQRAKDIGYRAWKAAYWLGEHGQNKVRVAEVVGAAAECRGLSLDISQRDQDVLSGDDWFRFLLDCRATVGVQGGASVLDHDGSIKATVEDYVKEHPDKSFEEVRAACFPGRDHELGLACISPRHFEACMTETCQILVEGHFNGILEPWKHYIPVKTDYSNVDQALDALQDRERTEQMVRQAYRDVVGSGRWTYRTFVRETEATVFDETSLRRMDLRSWYYYLFFRWRDWLLWRFIHLEVMALFTRKRSRPIRVAHRYALRFLPAP